jgi:hypothetical protein
MSNQSSGGGQAEGKERRAWVRYHSKPETPLFAIGEQEEIHSWKARVRDISQGGISLLSTSKFEQDSLVDIELSVPDVDATRLLLARVVRVHQAEGPIWLIACAFDIPLSEEELQQIAAEDQAK